MISRDELVTYLNNYLAIDEIKDSKNAVNGLQVEGTENVSKLMSAVDGTTASVNAAVERDADMMIVHHGILWSGLKPIVGPLKARIGPLLEKGISLYSAHLPLDAHPEIGNNAQIAALLGIDAIGRFGDYHGTKIGVWGETDMTLEELADKLGSGLNAETRIVPAGGDSVRKVGIVSGGGSDSIAEAKDNDIDTLVTGECPHQAFIEAEELGINVVYAGHYATETVGVKALGDHLAKKFSLEHTFFDHPTGL